jgi:hypothetical protein
MSLPLRPDLLTEGPGCGSAAGCPGWRWRVSDGGSPCLGSVCAAGDHGLLLGGALPGGLRLPPLPALPAGRSRSPHGPHDAQPHRLVHRPPETLRLHRNSPQVGRPPGLRDTPAPVNSLCDRSACSSCCIGASSKMLQSSMLLGTF